ncbi:hypothetical protein D9758_011667 [Tetrapyrgos nigripes]|uniref:MULE transposase domain-containing protein n=1 Tax=Tetrapyrgos nigripes TaxID=182062 RepID=A0A8H5CU09_9AGAR|nr:hypothetical protein D9758_011667 [Tetrapyrgos nigripes]
MKSFDCEGWVHITLDDHFPGDIRKMIDKAANTEKTVGQLWAEVLRLYPKPMFTQKAVYSIWHEKYSSQYRRMDDEVGSAKKVLEECADSKLGNYTIEQVLLPEQPGVTAIAFIIPDMLKQWAGRICEIALDSAWEMNTGRFELRNGGLTPIITLSDKDTSEINALQQEFPEAKHQLCYWHAEHAVKTHLSILHCAPTPYNVDQAQSEFPWIDKDFVPRGQHIGVQNSQPDYVAQTCIPRITVQLNSVVQPVPVPVIPKLIIKIPALSNRISPVIDPASEPDSTPEPVPLNIPTQSSMTDSTLPHQLGDEPELGDDMTGDDLQSRIAQDKEIEVDQEDGPDWLLEENEVKSKDPNYVFCPAPHRWQLLHIFTKHFCQHPSFPEQSGTYGAKSIWEHAVAEMYQFCKAHGLTEVWGYMWMLWYSPSKWLLWARSSTKYISCLWTTMCVENFWKQLKHHWLHYLIRPRLDQLV